MKIESLYIEKYKLLENFKISFKKDISILIGINGSGKSSILEAIALIFSSALLKGKSPFGYKIKYELFFLDLYSNDSPAEIFRNQTVTVELSSERDEKCQFKVTAKNEEVKKVITKGWLFREIEDVVPKNIIIYYSGLSETMKSICEPHNKLLSEEYRKGKANAHNPFFYFEPAYFDIILLSLLSYQYGDIPTFLSDKAKIDYLQSVQIRLKRPEWSKGKIDNWWGARGEIKSFLDYLDSLGKSLIIDHNSPLNDSIGNVIMEGWQNESLIISIINQEKLYSISQYYGDEKKLFQILNILYRDGFLNSMEFAFKNKEGNSFKTLSEGEKQAIIIRGLIELTNTENTLFLFDEPDTYLHPSWQSAFIEDITKTLQTNKYNSSQFIITTHSPQLLSNLKSGELHIMSDGKLVKHTNDYYGRDINAILSGYMDADFRPHEFQAIIDEVSELITQKKYDEAKQKLEFLNKKDNEYLRLSTKLNFILG